VIVMTTSPRACRGFNVADGVRGLVQRAGPVDDQRDLPGFDNSGFSMAVNFSSSGDPNRGQTMAFIGGS